MYRPWRTTAQPCTQDEQKTSRQHIVAAFRWCVGRVKIHETITSCLLCCMGRWVYLHSCLPCFGRIIVMMRVKKKDRKGFERCDDDV